MKYEDLTRKIIGCAMKVHSTLHPENKDYKANNHRIIKS